MAYIGNDLQVAYQSYQIIDDISGSFNGSTTSFALLVGGVAPVPFPINEQQCLISVGGVIQEPDPSGTNGFRFSGGNIVFSSAPNTGEDFFGVILAGADYVNVGVNYPSGSESAPSITFDTSLDTGIYSPSVNQFAITTAGVERVNFKGSTEVVFNDGGNDVDFRVEGDTKADLFKVDAGTDAVSIDGTAQLANQTPLRFGDSDNSHYVALRSPGTVAANVTWDLPSADGTADQSLVTDGSGSLSFATRSRLVLGTAVASTSGASVEFNSIPSWVERITVMLNGISTTGSSYVQIQIGSGSFTTSGYAGSTTVFSSTYNYSAGFIVHTNIVAATVAYSTIVLVKVDGNTWLENHSTSSAGNAISVGNGGLTLSGTLDRVRITTVNGTDTFDAGTINILWEG